jgi:hypothetical protein
MKTQKIPKPPAIEWTSIAVLLRELGIMGSIGVGIKLAWKQIRGEPFKNLDPAKDLKEKYSRMQIGPAILLYQILIDRLGKDEGYRMTEKVVIAAGASFLKKSIGPMTQSALQEMQPAERQEFVQLRGQRFFNAEMEWTKIEADEVQFTVSKCHFPILCRDTSVPELAILFCKTDEAYFGSLEDNVRLERPHTLANGGPNCPFTLTYGQSEPMTTESS